MFGKNRNKKVGLCVMVVTASLVLAGLWAVLATPETALAHKDPENPHSHGGGNVKEGDKSYSVDAVSDMSDHDPSVVLPDPILYSTCSGSTGKNTLFVKWPSNAIEITPVGGYSLTDDPQLSVLKKRGEVIWVQFFIQDVIGPDGIFHSTDKIWVDHVEPSSAGAGFTLHLHKDNVEVWRHKGHTGGPRVVMIGTISVGDIVFTLVE